ncbi:hypothetical protein [Bacillus sp. 1NLA3E]|uniref:hypothetical protein n=1 Tax=Bacillus sp. 1NLA3E TaxID=666686 RepID=UPI000247ECB9|nr:hypothetical protein [Bacillus sp. 1NLA3E]AGK52314.1 YjcN [Bacillus sp. 1NLA3E]
MKKKNIILIVSSVILILIILSPLLAPIIHNDNSPRSAIRNYIQKSGHPYQSFFAVINDKNYKDDQYGKLYEVLWKDWDNVTGTTPSLCYAKKTADNIYKVSCGTGP